MALFVVPLSWNRQVGRSFTGNPVVVGATLHVSVTVPLKVVEVAVTDVLVDCPGEEIVRSGPDRGGGDNVKLDPLTVMVADAVVDDPP
jgi:hypothetical protein